MCIDFKDDEYHLLQHDGKKYTLILMNVQGQEIKKCSEHDTEKAAIDRDLQYEMQRDMHLINMENVK